MRAFIAVTRADSGLTGCPERRCRGRCYMNGYSSYLEGLNALRDLAQAESSVIDAKRAQLSGVVALYKAVGGGWGHRNDLSLTLA